MTGREARPRSDASLLKSSNRPSNLKKHGKPAEVSGSEVASKAKEIGKKLVALKSMKKKDDFIDLIRALAQLLQSSSQRSAEVKRATGDIVKALGSNDLMKHKDREVKMYVVICCFHVLRLHAPDTPFSDETLTSVFHLFVAVMKNLGDTRSPFFKPSLELMEMAAKIKCCLLMLDLEQADGLLVDLCNVIFQSLTSQEVCDAIQEPCLDMLRTLIDESDVISQPLLDCILGSLAPLSLGGDADDISDVAEGFAQKLVRRSRESLQPHVQKCLTQILDGVRTDTDLVGNPSQLVLRVYEASPQIMLPVIPQLEPSLRVEDTDRRLDVVELICKLLSSHEKSDATAVRHLSCEYPQLLDGVLGRLNDKEPSVRIRVLQHAYELIENLPLNEQKTHVAHETLLRLKDADERVRIAATVACCSIASDMSDVVQDDGFYKALTVRLWDRKLSVRKETARGFIKIIKAWCLECENVQAFPRRKKVVEFVVGICSLTKVADAELASFIEDEVLRQGIFPLKKLSPALVCDWWSAVWTESSEKARGPIIELLKRKCSLQEHVASMLQLRLDVKSERKTRTSVHGLANMGANKTAATGSPTEQTLSDRLDNKIERVAALLKHVPKAHESLEKIFGMKDNNLFKNLASLATLGNTFTTTTGAAKDLQSRLGTKGPTAELAQALSARMCPTVIPPEILTIALKNATENEKVHKFVVELSSAEPRLFVGELPTLTKLLTCDDELESSLAVEILGNAGKYMFTSEKILLDNNALERLVELCCCGRHRSSKHAAYALMHATKYLGEEGKELIDMACNDAWGSLRQEKVVHDHSALLSHVKVLSIIMRMNMDKMDLYSSRLHTLVMDKLLVTDLSSGKPLSSNISSDSSTEPSWSNPSPDVAIKAELIKALSQSIAPILCTRELTPNITSLAKQFCEELQDLTDMDTSAPQFQNLRWKLNRVNWSGQPSNSSGPTYDSSQYSAEEKLSLEKQIADASPDAGWMRLAAAKAMFRLFRTYDSVFTGNDYLGLGLACQDSMVEVREDLLKKIDSTVHYFQHLGPGGAKQRAAKMAALYALYGADPYEPNMKKAFRGLRRYICKRRSILQKMSLAKAAAGDSGTMVNEMPEFILPFLVYFMAHHPDYDAEAMSQVEAGDELMALFKDSLQIALEALMLPQSTNQKDRDSLAAILKSNAGVSLKILRQLKYSDIIELDSEAVDFDATQNGHQICDIGLSLTRRILHEFSPIEGVHPSGFSGPIHLPKRYWQPKRVREEDKRLDGSDLPPQLKGPPLRGLFSESCGARLKFKKPRGKKRQGKDQVVEQAKKKKEVKKVVKEEMEDDDNESIEDLFSDDEKE